MDILSIIEKKKNKVELSDEEIQFFINGVCDDSIPDYQSAALLMAIRLNGMNKRETVTLTKCMLKSGAQLDLSMIPGVKCDKHSTGGVGDKTSLALCPMVAALGLKIAKMSGRGLGFTGGTLDKMESIPGMKVELTPDEFIRNVLTNGISIIGQSKDIDPADKKLYALRDVTGTIDSLPLITASIMSKKLAAGCDCILLDVKYGSGAFCQDIKDAERLAQMMVEIGVEFNKDVRAEITSMDQPLGMAVGNILEVKEAIETLHGRGPKDFTELCLSSGSTMLVQAGEFTSIERARSAIQEVIDDGTAFEVLKKFVASQGGDVSYIEEPSKFQEAMYKIEVKSVMDGFVSRINAKNIGLISMALGAGRETKEDIIDPAAGILLNKKIGDRVQVGDVLLTMYTERPKMEKLVADSLSCFEISEQRVAPKNVVEELVFYDRQKGKLLITKD